MIKSRIAAGALLLAVAGAAHAGEFSVTPTITNDYDFRGLSMTDEGPAFQLGANYAFDSGFYVGAWGSNIDPTGNNSGLEVDYFGGYAGSTDSFGYDLGVIYYTYSGIPGGSDANTLEAFAGISKDWLSGKLSFSDDYRGSDESAFYLEGNAAFPLQNNFSLLAHVGYGFGDVYADEVFDYSAGVGYAYKNFNFAVKGVDTDLPGEDIRLVATVSTTLPWAN